jgi:alanyl-tRNA synthetase
LNWPENIAQRVDELSVRIKELEKELKTIKSKISKTSVDQFIQEAETVGQVKVLIRRFDGADADFLRSIIDSLKEKVKSGIFLFGSQLGEKALFACGLTGDLVKQGLHAGKIIDTVAKVAGGGGGGRPDLAQAGASDVAKIDQALEKGKEYIKESLK